MKKKIIALSIVLSAAFNVHAQQNFTLPAELVSFFCGKWQGEGQFSNGKTIEASVYIHPAADSSWLMYEHTDKLPNRYKAVSFWSVEKNSGQFLAYSFFNSQGHSQFESDGWKDNKLILATHYLNASTNTTRWQHFIYEKLTDNSFKMTYETSTDGSTWKMGDYLTFTKTKD